MASVQEFTGIHYPTLLALDSGDVKLCEWTVERIAKALHVEPSMLLIAERFAGVIRTNAN
ncbi:hypothetical protein RA224_09200 [Achromobacter aegrifaciens]|uniref:helix-turn-helix domain-containing protein n=1 Tax=Achromobacter aegrifaciens TaxID=1287736 RepID=UPI0027BA1ED9|nr:hypothetical protein [Achromobacter aegrifaciens]WLW63580.1 hypothetical protein RA224_09200 [Achromobacter aegrifaciens]